MLESTFFLSQPAAKMKYGISTSAGRLSFDNAAAHYIVKALATGPRRLADIAEASVPSQDLLANALTLCASLAIWPVESNRVPVANLNAAIYGRLGGAEEIHCAALPFGTALAVDRDQLVRLRDGATASIDERTSWVQLQMSQL